MEYYLKDKKVNLIINKKLSKKNLTLTIDDDMNIVINSNYFITNKYIYNFIDINKDKIIKMLDSKLKEKEYYFLGKKIEKVDNIEDEILKLDIENSEEIDQKEFEKAKVDFYVVMTNIESGKPEYVLIKDVFKQMEYLRATSALPFASKIIKINNKKYLDGGISDSIPIDFCESLGYDKIILILTRPENSYKEDKLNFLYKLVYRKYPNLVERLINMGKDYEVVLKKIKDLENKDKIFVIRPPEILKIGRLEKNKDKIQKVYDIGLNTGLKEIDNLLKYLNK